MQCISHTYKRNRIHCVILKSETPPTIELLQYKSYCGDYIPSCKRHVPAAAHHVARLLKVCDLIAGETYFSSSRNAFACFYVLRHCSTFTWQQRVTKTGRREIKWKALTKQVSNNRITFSDKKKVTCVVNTYSNNWFETYTYNY